ncbi:hypothetical protein ElyMa_004614400 [Elysia marginata]|uniref:CARMIL C-terminal domain-containing protein n=1 Tax=Elysia marginata TaxID=1093978 RepID=A0AAV4I207_9GAST|nr:hypothetical protein ElyMa_004614400 [Elysia marginata]
MSIVSVFDVQEEMKSLQSEVTNPGMQLRANTNTFHAEHRQKQKTLTSSASHSRNKAHNEVPECHETSRIFGKSSPFHRPWLVKPQRKGKVKSSQEGSPKILSAELWSHDVASTSSTLKDFPHAEGGSLKDVRNQVSLEVVSRNPVEDPYGSSTINISRETRSLQNYLQKSSSCVDTGSHMAQSDKHLKNMLHRSFSETSTFQRKDSTKIMNQAEAVVMGKHMSPAEIIHKRPTASMSTEPLAVFAEARSITKVEENVENLGKTRRKLDFNFKKLEKEDTSAQISSNQQHTAADCETDLGFPRHISSDNVCLPSKTKSIRNTHSTFYLPGDTTSSNVDLPATQFLPSTYNPPGDRRCDLYTNNDERRSLGLGAASNWRESKSLNSSDNPIRQDTDLMPSTSTARPLDRRREDEVDIRLEVVDIMQETSQLSHRLEESQKSADRQCECARVEREILATARELFRRLCTEVESRGNWSDEIRSTSHVIRDALDLTDSLRVLCRHGRRVQDVLPGSIIIRVRCPTLTSLVDLCDLQKSGELQNLCSRIFCVPQLVTLNGVTLKVTLDIKSVDRAIEFKMKSLQTSTRKKKSSPKKSSSRKSSPSKRVVRSTENLLLPPSSPHDPQIWKHGRCCSTPVLSKSSPLCSPSTPCSPATPNFPLLGSSNGNQTVVLNRPRKFSFGETGARIAFQELNLADSDPSKPSILSSSLKDESPFMATAGGIRYDVTSGSRRLRSPNLVLTSPRRRNSDTTSPLPSPMRLKRCEAIQEQENIDHDS